MPEEIKDPDEYERWLEENKVEGFVANWKSSEFMVHTAKCEFIQAIGARAHRKVVCVDFKKLVDWCDEQDPENRLKQCSCIEHRQDITYCLDKAYFFQAPWNLAESWKNAKLASATSLALNRDMHGRYREGDYLVLVEGGANLRVYALGYIEETDDESIEPLYLIKFRVINVIQPLLKDELDKDQAIKRPEDMFPGHYCKVEKLSREARQDPSKFPDTSFSSDCWGALSKELEEKGPQKHHKVFELPKNRVSFRQWEVLKTKFSGCNLGPRLLLEDDR